MNASSRARQALLFLAAGLLAIAAAQGFAPSIRLAIDEEERAQARLESAKRRATRLPRYEQDAAELLKLLAPFKGKETSPKAKELALRHRQATASYNDSRQAVLEYRGLEKSLAEAEAKAKPFRALEWVLAWVVRAAFAAAALAWSWSLLLAWRFPGPPDSLSRGLWVIAPALGILMLLYPCIAVIGEVWRWSEASYQSAACCAAAGLLLGWFRLSFFGARTQRAFGGGAWDWKETGPGRVRGYAFSRLLPADLTTVGFGMAWMFLILLGGLTLIVLFPAVAGAAAGWTAVLLSVAVPFAMGRSLKRLVYQAFGIEPGTACRPAAMKGPVLQLAMVALVVGLLMWAGHRVNHGRFDAYKAELKGRGLPVSLSELQEEAADDQYGEAAFTPVLEKVDPKNTFNSLKHPGLELKAWTRATAEAEAAALKQFEPIVAKGVLPLAGRYSRYMKVDLVAGSKDPWSTPIPKFAGLIRLGNILRLCAESHAFRSEPAKAWAYVRAQFDLADLTSREHTLIGKMITVALRRQAAHTLLVIALSAPELSLPKDVVKRLDSHLGSRLVIDGLRSELVVRLDSRDWLERMRYKDRGRLSGLILSSEQTGGAQVLEYAALRAFILMGAWDLNALAMAQRSAAYVEMTTWPQSQARVAEEAAGLPELPLWPYFLTAIATPRFGGLLEKEWELKTWLQLSLTAHALNEHRKAAGKFPGDLAALAPKRLAETTLVDVFAGGRFAYAPKKDGYELCSAGSKGDRKDTRGDRFCVVRD